MLVRFKCRFCDFQTDNTQDLDYETDASKIVVAFFERNPLDLSLEVFWDVFAVLSQKNLIILVLTVTSVSAFIINLSI